METIAILFFRIFAFIRFSNEILNKNQQNVFLERIGAWVERTVVGDGGYSCVTLITLLFEAVSSPARQCGVIFRYRIHAPYKCVFFFLVTF